MTSLLLLLTFASFHAAFSIPILNNDETKLNSIVISEINLPTESSLVIVDQEIVAEPVASFVDLVENYEGMYGKETENEFTLQKRSSTDDDENKSSDPDAGGKSLIDKIEIPDPEVKKEFENELEQNQIMKDDDDETTENTNIGTEYDPNYERKLVILPQADENVADVHNETASLSVHDKENLQVQLVEQLVHQNENQHEFTTIVPEKSFTDHALIKNPEIVEVLEHIVYDINTELKVHEHTTSVPIPVLNMDVDPIEIIPKDRHREAKEENTTDINDKFAGFVGIPTEDLIQAGEETTESDNFFRKEEETTDEDDVDPVEAVRETLEYVAIYGRSLNVDDSLVTTEIPPTTIESLMTESSSLAQTTPSSVTKEQIYETKTEIVEVNVQVSINSQIANENESKKSSSSEESSQQSLPSNSSEENESKEDEKEKSKNEKLKSPSTSSEEDDAENVAKEDLSDEKMDLRSLEFPVSQKSNTLPEEIFKDATVHEIKKKDHPDGIELTYEFKGRQLSNENPEIEDGAITMTTVIETFEEVVTTISEGINLSKELRRQVESFRGDSEENKIILDTDNEAISSKNFKNPLVGVNDLEMMKLKERSFEEEPKLSVAVIPFVAVMSVGILFTLYKFVKGQASSVRLY